MVNKLKCVNTCMSSYSWIVRKSYDLPNPSISFCIWLPKWDFLSFRQTAYDFCMGCVSYSKVVFVFFLWAPAKPKKESNLVTYGTLPHGTYCRARKARKVSCFVMLKLKEQASPERRRCDHVVLRSAALNSGRENPSQLAGIRHTSQPFRIFLIFFFLWGGDVGWGWA